MTEPITQATGALAKPPVAYFLVRNYVNDDMEFVREIPWDGSLYDMGDLPGHLVQSKGKIAARAACWAWLDAHCPGRFNSARIIAEMFQWGEESWVTPVK